MTAIAALRRAAGNYRTASTTEDTKAAAVAASRVQTFGIIALAGLLAWCVAFVLMVLAGRCFAEWSGAAFGYGVTWAIGALAIVAGYERAGAALMREVDG